MTTTDAPDGPVRRFEALAAAARSLAELNALFGRQARAHGFTAYAAGYGPGEDGAAPGPFLLLDWPQAWLELYAREGFAQEDAVVAAARHACTPFTWGEVRAADPAASARVFAAAAAFGWTDGLLVPVREGAEGRVGVVSLAAPRLDGLGPEGLARVAALAAIAFRRAAALADAGPTGLPVDAGAPEAVQPLLSPRERDALALVARGLGDAEIAAELGVATATAHFHVERAKRKLGATTRAQAVALAIASRHLDG